MSELSSKVWVDFRVYFLFVDCMLVKPRKRTSACSQRKTGKCPTRRRANGLRMRKTPRWVTSSLTSRHQASGSRWKKTTTQAVSTRVLRGHRRQRREKQRLKQRRVPRAIRQVVAMPCAMCAAGDCGLSSCCTDNWRAWKMPQSPETSADYARAIILLWHCTSRKEFSLVKRLRPASRFWRRMGQWWAFIL